MNIYLTALLNTIFVSIPEETMWAALCLLFLERFDLLDFRALKFNIKWWALLVLPLAIISNISKYILLVTNELISIMFLFLFIINIYIVLKRIDFLNKLKLGTLILVVFLVFCIMALSEMIYAPTVLYLSNVSLKEINNNLVTNFLLSFPSRVIQIVLFFLVKYKKLYKLSFLEMLKIFNNKFYYSCTFITLSITILLWVLSQKVVFNNQTVVTLSMSNKLLIGNGLILMPTIFMIIVIFNCIYNHHKIYNIEKKYSNMLEELD